MASSRLEKVGTIFSRITGLLRSGALKMEDKPLWYDIYKHFPPITPPKYGRPEPNIELKPIFYPEDMIRAKIHKEKSVIVGVVNLSKTDMLTNTQKCISIYEELKHNGADESTALDEAVERVAAERGVTRTERQDKKDQPVSLAAEFKRSKVNVADLFKNES